jgi:hypothetical protein
MFRPCSSRATKISKSVGRVNRISIAPVATINTTGRYHCAEPLSHEQLDLLGMKLLSDVGDAILTNSLGSLSRVLVKIGPSVTHCTTILWSGFDLRIRSDRTDTCTAQYYDSHLTLRWTFYPPRCRKRCRHTVCWPPYRCPNPPPPCCMSTTPVASATFSAGFQLPVAMWIPSH